MKIKNIQQYRTLYKSTRPVSDKLKENFIGNYYIDSSTNKKEYGWFSLYHGDKDGYRNAESGIANFLQRFLDTKDRKTS